MRSAAIRRVVPLAACFLAISPPAFPQDLPPDQLAHYREELGVNNFTAPSIGRLLQQLAALQPVPYNKVARPPATGVPQSRARLALASGAVIADGLLAVTAEKQSRIEPIGRALLRYSKGLGIGNKVTSHAQSLLELAARERWAEMREELIRAQAEVEGALLALKDEELAHLVSLGGWMRGLEICSEAVLARYSPEASRGLIQPEVLGYFTDRVSTLHPQLRREPLFQLLTRNLAEIRKIAGRPRTERLSKEDVQRLSELSREVNQAIAQ